MHRCYSCRNFFAANEAGGATACFPARFEGPPGAANGGIALGTLACPALTAASREGAAHAAATRISARIRAAVPLETPLAVDVEAAEGAYAVTIRDDAPLITGVVEIARLDAPPLPGDALASVPAPRADDVAALARVDAGDGPAFFEALGEHSVPRCFSCGPERDDGLRIFPRVAGEGVVCAPWRAGAEYDDGDGALPVAILVAALDCSSGICMPLDDQRRLIEEDRFFLLGSLDVTFLRVPPAGRDYHIAARALGWEGRKFFGLSALFDDTGVPYAMAGATWIVAGTTRSEAFGART